MAIDLMAHIPAKVTHSSGSAWSVPAHDYAATTKR
jgi:hypothetical protein